MRRHLSLVLPPGWPGLPLTDAERTQAKIRRIVDDVPLDDGTGARIRRELRDSLLAEAGRARESGATLLGLAGPRSAPISGSLLVTPLAWSLDPDGTWIDDLEGDADQAVVSAGRVVRLVRTRQPVASVSPASPERGGLAEDLLTLAVDYWLTGESGRTVLIACSTPMVIHREAMIGLFDAVMETATWHAGPTEAG